MSSNTTSQPTEFVAEAFETSVSTEAENELIRLLDTTIRTLRKKVKDDDTLEKMLRAGRGNYVLRSSMTTDGLQPESFTQQSVIEPLLDGLGYEYDTEAGGLSGGRTMVADYTVSLRDQPTIDSTRLLIEAEPINKEIDSRKHGIGQVRDWLSKREFESDFGFATDGLRWAFVRYDPDSYTHNVIEEVDLQPVFIALFENQVGKQNDPTEAVFDADRSRITRLIQTFEFDNFVSIAGDARKVIERKKKEITDDFYEDYTRYVFGIVSDEEETARSLVGEGVVVPEGATENEARLFAVEMMNRLVFIKFLEDKELVHPDLLRTLKETYEEGYYTDTFYEQFLQSLFYDVMNSKLEDRPGTVQDIELFEGIPYLNGGLFRQTINGDEFNERDFDVRNSVLFSIIDLLESYNFSAKGSPTDLDPSVLGNVFEKTINYISTDDGDTNKELGAYYTPSEITRFCAEETVRPALLDRFETTLVEECDWPEHEAERFDSVYELIDGLPGHMGTIGPLLDEIDQFRVVDPSCGSGHFLTSVLEEIVNIRKSLYAQNENFPEEYRLKKTTVLNNIYGVDIMGPAVEIAKLRCWLSIISELETANVDDLADADSLALPNIAFNLREGNSLIGYTGFPETTEGGDYKIGAFSEDSVRDRYQDIIDEIQKHEQAIDSETAEKHRRRAFKKLQTARDELTEDIHADFVDAGIEDITPETVAEMEPFNWVLEFAEVYADGGFDVIVGNPPWDVLTPNREEFFSRYEPDFRGMTPNKKDDVQKTLLQNKEINQQYEEYEHRINIQAQYFNKSPEYELQSPTVAGRTISNENDLSALFFERVFDLGREDSYIGQVLPGFVWNGAACKDLRSRLIDDSTLKYLTIFENNGIFENIHYQYKFGVAIFKNSGTTEEILGRYEEGNVKILNDIENHMIRIPRDILEAYSPKSRIFPYVTSQMEADVLRRIVQHPSIEDPVGWWGDLVTKELHEPTDKGRFVTDKSEGDYPVYGGSNIYQYQYDTAVGVDIDEPRFWSKEKHEPEKSAKYRVREKAFRKGRLKKSIYEEFDGGSTSQSQVGFVNDLLEKKRGEELGMDDILPDYTEYRIGYRNVTNATNERTMISTILPKNIPCVETLQTFRPYYIEPREEHLSESPLHNAYCRIFTNEELFVVVGLLNSIPFDFLMRTKIDTHIVKYKLEESQIPHLTKGDEWFDYISTRAARLNCYGDEFEEMRDRLGGIEPATDEDERREIQAEIDAAAFHAYGLDREQTAFVLDDFHRVQNPRIMDEAYFDMVLEKYKELA